MYAIMSTANVYPTQKQDKSQKAVQHGFVKTIIHISILLVAIIIMSVYYAQITETKRKTIQVDKTKEEWISYEQYQQLWVDYGYESIISCDCAKTQIDWESITDSVDINDDYVCNAVLAAYGSCYYENNCRNGKVGKIIFWYLNELCTSAQALYPTEKPPYSLTSAKVYTVDELYAMSVQLAVDWQSQIAQPMQATFLMTYPLINNKTEFFYDWAITTRFEDLENSTYWNDVWGLQNSSYGIANVFSDVLYDELGYLTVADAIESAFIDYIHVNYKYSNSSAADFSSYGYYQMCRPYQCVWFIIQKKTFIEIVVIIFG
eukprot:433025_1